MGVSTVIRPWASGDMLLIGCFGGLVVSLPTGSAGYIKFRPQHSEGTRMPRIKFEVTGKVQGLITCVVSILIQGVFFRVSAVHKATSLGVTGWIRNTQQQTVVGEAQHKDDTKLNEFIKERLSQIFG